MIRIETELASARGFKEWCEHTCWAGAADNLESFSDDDWDFLYHQLSDSDPMSATQLNDFIWFDAPTLLEEESLKRQAADLDYLHSFRNGFYLGREHFESGEFLTDEELRNTKGESFCEGYVAGYNNRTGSVEDFIDLADLVESV